MTTLNLCLMNLKKILEIIYMWISEPTDGAKYSFRVTTLFIYHRMGDGEGCSDQNNRTRRQKQLENKMRESILVVYVIDGETWLQNLVGVDVSYLSYIHFEQLDAGDKS